MKISAIKYKGRVLFPGPGFLSSAIWPSMPKKHFNGLIYQSIIYSGLCPASLLDYSKLDIFWRYTD